ncbi:MAG: AraC family transcriptional regulator [Spirochaetota bacterium]
MQLPDPLFGLMDVAFTAGHGYRDTFNLSGRRLSFRKGRYFFAAIYGPQEGDDPVLHTHRFLEVQAVVRGSMRYVTADGERTIRRNEVLFVNNQVAHSVRTAGERGSQVLTMCLMPAALGYTDDMLDEQGLAGAYRLVRPFFPERVGDPYTSLTLSDSETRRIAFYGMTLVEMYMTDRVLGTTDLIRFIMRSLYTLYCDNVGDTERNAYIFDIIEYLSSHFTERITLADVSARVGLSPNYVSAVFNRVTGKTMMRFINERRMERAKHLLASTTLSVREISALAGYDTVTHFNDVFREITAASPLKFRRAIGGSAQR